jgi:hypothetical protein
VIVGLGLSAFWGGVAAGLNYAVSFVVIMLLHWTVATKQPAMTAPSMAAKLKDLQSPQAYEDFVTEVVHLLRSQFVAIVGNVVMVLAVAYALAAGIQALGWGALVDDAHARHILDEHHMLGRTIPYAIVTGALLFASSIIAGWVENWFVLHRLDSVIAYHPRITRRLGAERAPLGPLLGREHLRLDGQRLAGPAAGAGAAHRRLLRHSGGGAPRHPGVGPDRRRRAAPGPRRGSSRRYGGPPAASSSPVFSTSPSVFTSRFDWR